MWYGIYVVRTYACPSKGGEKQSLIRWKENIETFILKIDIQKASQKQDKKKSRDPWLIFIQNF